MKTKLTFAGRHYETGTVQNALALQGVKAPHTGQPYSEALLLGVSGGIAFGYFTFEYKGFLPHVALLTRNTFNPLSTLLERLGIAQDVQQTNKPELAERNLVRSLESGLYPLAWVDQFSLLSNDTQASDPMWMMIPVLAAALADGTVTVADRSSQPWHIPMDRFTRARGRVKQDRFRLVTLEAPQPAKLAAAVQKGLLQTIQLFTEAPPKGGRDNFGFAAFEKLAGLLTNTRNKQGWERFFPAGVRMYHALAGAPSQPGAYQWINTWGAADGAERGLYADFLDEAAVILKKPALMEAAALFRESHALWLRLAESLLPDNVPLLGESKQVISRKHKLFVEKGETALPEIRSLNARHRELLKAAETDFPLSTAQAAERRAQWQGWLLRIQAVERQAVDHMQSAIL